MTFKKAQPSDIDYLLWLRMETMEKHLLDSGVRLTEEGHLARVKYAFENAKIILLKGEKIGLLKLKESQGEMEILQIQIDPKYQGKGWGSKIIQTIIRKAEKEKKILNLSVLKKNKAKYLYEKLGFKVVDETHDSFIMKI